MLQQLSHIIVVSFVCFVWGIPVVLALSSSIKRDHYWYHSTPGLVCFLFFCGCLLLGGISSWIYLFAPLKFVYLLISTIGLLFYLSVFQSKKIRNLFLETSNTTLPFFPLLFVFVSIALFLLLGTLQPVNGDTQIYHLQIIRWQAEQRVVPGIANIYPRFGLGSNWFNLISFFYWTVFKTENFTYLNVSFVIWFFLWLVSKWNFHFQERHSKTNHFLSTYYFLLLAYCMFDWQLYRDAANSTNYDFAITAFTIIISSFFIEGVFTNRARNEFSIPLLIFALCAISFKLSGVFLLFFVFYHILVSWKTTRWRIVIITGVFIFFPTFLKNYVTSGYPLFPSTFTINTPDWILPKEMAEGFYRHIILANRFYNYQWSFINNIEHTTFNWIPYWIKGILWKHKIIVGLSACSVFFIFIKTSLPINHKHLRSIIVILLLMTAGWFFTAPDPGRFGYGILLSASLLTTSLTIYRFVTAKLYHILFLATTILLAMYVLKKSRPILNNPGYTIYPIAFPEPPFQVFYLNNISLKFPYRLKGNGDHRCYFAPLPCINQINPYLQARGKNLKDGFRMYPQPDSNFISTYLY